MISYSEANKIIEEELRKLEIKTELVGLLESTNRILAEDIISDINLPPFTNSAVDGYAIKFNEEVNKWKIIGEIGAGNYKDYEIGDGLAVSIMTGGKMPPYGDSVIPIEDVIIENDKIELKGNSTYKKGMNIRKAGSDLLSNEIAINKNIIIKPKHIAVAATCGKTELKVFRKVKIGVLATGDELIDISETPGKDKIRSSNVYSILSAIKEFNQIGVDLGIAKDDKNEIRKRIEKFIESDIDILVTSGGVSVGKYDYVKNVLEESGVKINFWRVNIKPGKPLLFGTYGNNNKTKIIFGLPGNPVSCLVNFILFIKNNMLKTLGVIEDQSFIAELAEAIFKKDNKKHFMRGFYKKDSDGNIFVNRVGTQSSGNLAEMGKSNCLIIFDEDKIKLNKGDKVFCIPI
jgi:molybdopterin molybdotransferase